MRHLTTLILVIVVSCIGVEAQDSDPAWRRLSILDANAIGLSFYNDGQISGFNRGIDVRGEWQGNSYIGDITPLIGLELPVKDYTGDGIPDSIHSVVISRGPRNRQSEEKDPMTRQFRGFNPLRGFLDSSQSFIATNDNPASWPPVWPDHPQWGSGVWNGRKGPNTSDAPREAYFQIDDTWDNEMNEVYGFLPDSSDTSRMGHGLKVAIRYFQFDSLLSDAIFFSYEIMNTGTQRYDRMVWGNITGTISGGDGDSQDDLADYDARDGFVYSYDADGMGNVGQRLGIAAQAMLTSPTGDSAGSFRFFNINAAPAMDDDEGLWRRLKPGVFDPLPAPQDGDPMFGTDYFSLAPGETAHVTTALIMGSTLDEIVQRVLIARAFWYADMDWSTLLSTLHLNSMAGHPTYSGSHVFTWDVAQDVKTVDIWLSRDNGVTWQNLRRSITNAGAFLLQTDSLNDTPFAKLRIFGRNTAGHLFCFTESPAFTIDNAADGTPFVAMADTTIGRGATITDNVLSLPLIVCDPEYAPVTLDIDYSTDAGVTFIPFTQTTLPSDTLAQIIDLELFRMKNSEHAVLHITASDGQKTGQVITEQFRKITSRDTLNPGGGEHTGPSEVTWYLSIVDSSALLHHEYVATFTDTGSTRVSIRDVTAGEVRIDNELLLPGIESSVFDGMTFTANNFPTSLDTARSHYTGEDTLLSTFTFNPFFWSSSAPGEYAGYRQPNDYMIVFSPGDVDTSLADTLYPPTPSNRIPARPVNFLITNLTTGRKVPCVYFRTGTLSTVHNIYFKEPVAESIRRTWRVNIHYVWPGVPLPANDTLYLYTKKGLSSLDTLVFSGLTAAEERNPGVPGAFELHRNFPNPFNPTTTITYALPVQSRVSISIFNLLGQQVATIVDGIQPPGTRSVSYDASGLASGVYFCRCTAAPLSGSAPVVTRVQKMTLVK